MRRNVEILIKVNQYVQSGKESSSVADEFFLFDLIKIYAKNPNILDFQIKFLFFILYSNCTRNHKSQILFVTFLSVFFFLSKSMIFIHGRFVSCLLYLFR